MDREARKVSADVAFWPECEMPRCPLLRLLSESELTWVRHCRTVANDPNADLGGVFVQHLRTLARAPKALAGPLPVLLHYWIVSYHA
jgi:hypothetical protein